MINFGLRHYWKKSVNGGAVINRRIVAFLITAAVLCVGFAVWQMPLIRGFVPQSFVEDKLLTWGIQTDIENALSVREFTNVEKHSFFSSSLNQNVPFTIYLPPGYETENGQRYPVLYFLHGSQGDEWLYWTAISSTVEGSGNDAGAWLNQLIIQQTISPMIIVAPDDMGTFWIDLGEVMVTEELISYVDSNWRTLPEPGGRAIEGFSMGADGAARFTALNPDLFCSVVVMAGSHVDDLLLVWNSNRDQILANRLNLRLVVGEDDIDSATDMIRFHTELNTAGIQSDLKVLPGVNHNLGAVYDQDGITNLQFHTRCFSE